MIYFDQICVLNFNHSSTHQAHHKDSTV